MIPTATATQPSGLGEPPNGAVRARYPRVIKIAAPRPSQFHCDFNSPSLTRAASILAKSLAVAGREELGVTPLAKPVRIFLDWGAATGHVHPWARLR